MLLPIETSAPTYRKIARAPKTAQREVSAENTESSVLAGGGAELSIRLRERQMKTVRSANIAAMIRNDVSILRRDASRMPAAAAPLESNTPPRSISTEPR